MLTIRQSTNEDTLTICALEEMAYGSPVNLYPAMVAGLVTDTDCLVAEVDGKVVGMLEYRPAENHAAYLAVLPDYRLAGIARALFDAAHQEDGSAQTLWVRKENTGAQACYEACGFKQVPALDHEYAVNHYRMERL